MHGRRTEQNIFVPHADRVDFWLIRRMWFQVSFFLTLYLHRGLGTRGWPADIRFWGGISDNFRALSCLGLKEIGVKTARVDA